MAETARRKRKIKANWVAGCVLLALVLIVGGANLVATFQQVHAADRQTARVYATNISSCETSNSDRREQSAALDSILGLITPPRTAPQQEQQAAHKFLAKAHAFVSAGWAPRNCRALYESSSPEGN